MFTHLTQFEYKRSKKEAFGFYIAWFGFLLLVTSLIGALAGLLVPTEVEVGQSLFEGKAFELGLKMGTMFATLFSLAFSILICRAKGIISQFSSVVLIVLSGVLGLVGGGLLGFIIPAYLSTKDIVSADVPQQTPPQM